MIKCITCNRQFETIEEVDECIKNHNQMRMVTPIYQDGECYPKTLEAHFADGTTLTYLIVKSN